MPYQPRGHYVSGPCDRHDPGVNDHIGVDVWLPITGWKGRFQELSIRYEDSFTKRDDTWLFAERRLIIDWTDTRPSQA